MLIYRIIFLSLSISLQIAAAICAFRLISLTKKKMAWLFISSAILLMACRRFATLLGIFVPSHGELLRWAAAEGIALIISGFMLAGIVLIAHIFREKLRAEEDLRNIKNRLEYLNDILMAVWNVNQLIVRQRDVHRLMNEACEILVKTRGYRFAWVGLVQEGSYRVIPRGQAGFEDGYLSRIKITWDDSEHGKGPTGRAIKSRKPFVMQDIKRDPRFAPWVEEALKRGYASSAALPLITGERVLGALNVYAENPDAFDDEELRLLTELAGDLALGIQSIEDEQARKQAEEALLESNDRLQSIFEGAGDAMRVIDNEFNVVSANNTMAELTGLSKEQAVGMKCHAQLVGDHCRTEHCFLKRIQGGEQRVEIETVKSTADGRQVPVRGIITPLLQGGKMQGIIESFQDISERRRAEEQLRLFSHSVDSSVDAIAITNLDLKITYLNKAFAKMCGYSREESIGKQIAFFHPEDQIQKLEAAVKATMESGWTGELVGKRKDGEIFPIAVSSSRVTDDKGNTIALMASLRDITGRKKLEGQLRQAQKMEAIGTLAGGIAHDFNNILVPILGFADLAIWNLPAGSKARENLNEVVKAGIRAKDLVRQILAFSRETEGERRPIQLVPIVKEALKLLRAALPSTIEIRQNIAPDTGVVNGDPTQIHQIMMNLCTNAEHAMLEGGVLEVSLANVELDEEFCSKHKGLTADSHVRLTVGDTGRGMDKETLTRIFDPFFTTKGPGEGTGMGLSVVHGIVKSHGGDITVYSEPGVGTTFQVYLPVVKSLAEARPETVEPVPGGTESILIVDDDAVVAEIGRETLERLGYCVTTRTSSIEALELFRAKPGEFDLVITDQTMPHMTGTDLAAEILRIRPDIPIILCTGFSHVITPEKARARGIQEFVMKPIVGAELGRTVRRVLDR